MLLHSIHRGNQHGSLINVHRLIGATEFRDLYGRRCKWMRCHSRA